MPSVMPGRRSATSIDGGGGWLESEVLGGSDSTDKAVLGSTSEMGFGP